MKYLFDTQAFIWWDNAPRRLSPTVLQICEDRTNTLMLSVASLWEMQIKLQLGKLQLPLTLEAIVEHHQKNNRLELMPVYFNHVLGLQNLPNHHKDPFDRLIIAQANVEKLILITADSEVKRYPVETVW